MREPKIMTQENAENLVDKNEIFYETKIFYNLSPI